MDISVIFATYRRTDILYRTLQSFCKLSTPGLTWELIVVDNANDSNTQQLINGFVDNLPINYIVEIKIGKNNALNKAIEIAKGELLIFTDDDILADKDWLVEMWEGSRRWPDFSIFGGRILPEFPNGKIPISFDHPFYNNAYVVADWKINEGPYSVNKVWGPNMAILAEVFRAGWKFNPNIGPNGNNYVMGSESELLLRLEKAGFGAIYLRKGLVHHQIRPEQLSKKWLYGRAFRFGRSLAKTSKRDSVPYFFKAPRFLFRMLLEIVIKRIMFCFDNSRKADFIIQYWIIKGEIYQYWAEPIDKSKLC
jgi:glucosyl-dolichyl phosphate glucuronosyltransferase